MKLFHRSRRASLDKDTVEAVLTETHLSRGEVLELQQRFLTYFPAGFATKTAFLCVISPSPTSRPVCSRLFDLYCASPPPGAATREPTLGFRDFALLVSVFSPNAQMDDKLNLLFRVFDVECDGVITPASIEGLLREVVGASGLPLTEAQIVGVARDTVKRALLSTVDIDSEDTFSLDGVSLSHFKKMFMTCPRVLETVTVPLWNLVQTNQMDTNPRQIFLRQDSLDSISSPSPVSHSLTLEVAPPAPTFTRRGPASPDGPKSLTFKVPAAFSRVSGLGASKLSGSSLPEPPEVLKREGSMERGLKNSLTMIGYL